MSANAAYWLDQQFPLFNNAKLNCFWKSFSSLFIMGICVVCWSSCLYVLVVNLADNCLCIVLGTHTSLLWTPHLFKECLEGLPWPLLIMTNMFFSPKGKRTLTYPHSNYSRQMVKDTDPNMMTLEFPCTFIILFFLIIVHENITVFNLSGIF